MRFSVRIVLSVGGKNHYPILSRLLRNVTLHLGPHMVILIYSPCLHWQENKQFVSKGYM